MSRVELLGDAAATSFRTSAITGVGAWLPRTR
jgi:hypothetical protein